MDLISPDVCSLVVLGVPAPQGSKKAFVHRSTGRAVVVESSKKRLRTWRSDIVDEVLRRRPEFQLAGFRLPITGPIGVSMVFCTARPRSHYRTGRNAKLLRDDAPLRPTSRPDLSHLIRAVEDALTDAGLIKDDALIVEYRNTRKVFCGEDPQALSIPGARILVWAITGTPAPPKPAPRDTLHVRRDDRLF